MSLHTFHIIIVLADDAYIYICTVGVLYMVL